MDIMVVICWMGLWLPWGLQGIRHWVQAAHALIRTLCMPWSSHSKFFKAQSYPSHVICSRLLFSPPLYPPLQCGFPSSCVWLFLSDSAAVVDTSAMSSGREALSSNHSKSVRTPALALPELLVCSEVGGLWCTCKAEIESQAWAEELVLLDSLESVCRLLEGFNRHHGYGLLHWPPRSWGVFSWESGLCHWPPPTPTPAPGQDAQRG